MLASSDPPDPLLPSDHSSLETSSAGFAVLSNVYNSLALSIAMSRLATVLSLFAFFSLQIWASPTLLPLGSLEKRTYPVFPDTPTSCPICAKDYPSINSCAEAAPVLANFSMIIFNPGAFIDVIKCSCTDTFKAAFPQCVDCFIKTGQENILNTPNLPAVVDGMRKICGLESTLLGNVSVSNGDVTPSASKAAPAPTTTSGGSLSRQRDMTLQATFCIMAFALFMGL